MVLQGLTVPVWVGWIGGVVFFKVPWGIPKFDSWMEPIFLYHLTLTLISHLLWFDYIFNYKETFGGDIQIRQVITKVFTYMAVIFSSYLRLCFALQTRKTAEFFERLELHPVLTSRTPDKQNPVDLMDKTVLLFSLVMNSFAAGAFSLAVATQRTRCNSWFSDLSQYEYSVIFFLFATLPMAISINIAFSYAVVLTKHLVFIFEEFCNFFERTVNFGRSESLGLGLQSEILMDSPPPFTTSLIFQNKGDLMMINYKKEMKDSLWKEFDTVMGLFQMYDDIAGPFLLGLVIVTIMFFVQTVNAILIFDLSPLFLLFDWFTLICLVSQLVLILFNLGHAAHRTMMQRKLKLRRMLGSLPNTYEKEQLGEISELVSSWDWKLSAWGFFVIDRTLMPGVISIMMSYVVILFQLQNSNNTLLQLGLN